MRGIIILLSGKKGSGKNCLANHIVKHRYNVFSRPYVDCQTFAFADELKKFCVEYFNIKLEDCYSEDGKKKFTQYKWSDLPGVIVLPKESSHLFKVNTKNVRYHYGEDSFLTIREFLQEVGTGVMRCIFDKIWIDRMNKAIRYSLEIGTCFQGHNPDLHSPVYFLTDWRFPNELTFLETDCRLVTVRLTRDNNDHNDPSTKHISETALDDFTFDYVLDNANMTLAETKNCFEELVRNIVA